MLTEIKSISFDNVSITLYFGQHLFANATDNPFILSLQFKEIFVFLCNQMFSITWYSVRPVRL